MRQLIVLALTFLLCIASPCIAQRGHDHEPVPPEDERPVADSRSFAELFTKFEQGWIQAVQKKDKAALDAILAPEFILRTSWNPDNPIPRTAWMKHALIDTQISSFSQRTMAIRAFMGVAIVSFVQSQQETIDNKNSSCDYFIVDLWEVNHEKWQVATRFITKTGKSSCHGQ
jgi:hypothetical protein